MSDGWKESAGAWIAEMGEHGDFGRRWVVDPVMRARLEGRRFRKALDVGCGEGRFCRVMQGCGIATVGIDPTPALLAQARRLDPEGDYRPGRGEALEFAAAEFDLVVSYLSLIDMADLSAAVAEMVRVLEPGGTMLIANLTGFTTACADRGWLEAANGARYYPVDHYLEERAHWAAWRGIRVRNWHRPLTAYMRLLLGHGLRLAFFDEPAPVGGDAAKADRYRRVPFYVVMEWQKPD